MGNIAPAITILTPTCDLLYKDRQIEALEKQTFRDFEWVIVDDAYEQNKGVQASFPVKHIPPQNPVLYVALAAAMNDGIALVEGEIVYFMNDYVIPEPTCLERHWEVQQKMGGCMLSGGEWIMEDIPPLEFLIKDGQIITRDYRIALFENGFKEWKAIDDGLYEVGREGVQNWWAGRNDSCPLEALLACNGFDEAFDGMWGGHDADIANRLMTYGLKYYIDKKSRCKSYSHPRGRKKQVRSQEMQQSFQYTIINPKVEKGIYTANTEFLVMIPRNLREENGNNRRSPNCL